MISQTELWTVIAVLGVGSFLIRFVFLGLVGDAPLPPWVLRHLRYTAVAMLPALVAPLVVWPTATGGTPDPGRMAVAALTLAIAYLTKNVPLAILMGVGALYGLTVLF